MSRHIGATQCFFCEASTVRGPRNSQPPVQSYLLTADYIAEHPNIIDYARHLFHDRLITKQDRICRQCVQQADRFAIIQNHTPEQDKLSLALQKAGTNIKLVSSSRQASKCDLKNVNPFSHQIELEIDPMRGSTPQENHQVIPIKQEYSSDHEEVRQESSSDDEITEQDRIWRPGVQLADSFTTQNRPTQDRERLSLALQKAGTNMKLVSTPKQYTNCNLKISSQVKHQIELQIDPIRDTPQNHKDILKHEDSSDPDEVMQEYSSDEEITKQDKICVQPCVQPCMLHTERFVAKQQRNPEQDKFSLALQKAGTNMKLVSTPRQSSNSSLQSMKSPILGMGQKSSNCNLKISNQVKHQIELQIDPLRDNPLENHQDIFKREHSPDDEEVMPENSSEDEAPPNVKSRKAQQVSSYQLIPVPGFSRIASNSMYCLIAGCQYKRLHRIKLPVRSNILLKQNIYVPQGVRVCEQHLAVESVWQNLAAYCRPRIDTFNSSQIADMLHMLQKQNLKFNLGKLKYKNGATRGRSK